jgi:RNA polymerase sigma factor (sigma-70 family)
MPFQDQHFPNDKWQSIPDEGIWKAFKRGEKEALEHIYRRHINDLYNYGMKIKGHDCLVKDCIQELFVELWKSRNQISFTDNIKFYLLKALKLKINHRLKKESIYLYNHLKESTSVEVALSYESLLIQSQFQEEQIYKLNEVINRLPERQREIIHLLFFEGLSYEQVSEIMAINVRSVYTLAWKSLATLRRKLILFLSFFLLVWSLAC